MKGEMNTTDTDETHGSANVTGKLKSLFNKLFKKRGENKVINGENQLIEYVQIENTPFTAVKDQGRWYLTMGKYRLTEELESKEAAIKEGANESWWRIMQIIRIMIDDHDKAKAEQERIAELKRKGKINDN